MSVSAWQQRGAGVLLLAAALASLSGCSAWRTPVPEAELPTLARPAWDFELLGVATLPPGTTFGETLVGGLSGISYDSSRDLYYSISDDRQRHGPVRFYTLALDLADGDLTDDDVRIVATTTLEDLDGEAFEEIVDCEGLAWAGGDSLYISSEGHARTLIPSFVRRFSISGEARGELALPAGAQPRESGDAGVRHNLSYESLTVSADGRTLFTASENAWLQDGEATDVDRGSTVRILRYDLASERLTAAYAYEVDPVAEPPVPSDGFRVNGLVELLVLGESRLLALERSFSAGVGNQVRLYYADLEGATDVSGMESLATPAAHSLRPATKSLALDLATLGIELDNLEGLTFGPPLADGTRTLVLVSDNNFNDEAQVTQFLAFALRPAS